MKEDLLFDNIAMRRSTVFVLAIILGGALGGAVFAVLNFYGGLSEFLVSHRVSWLATDQTWHRYNRFWVCSVLGWCGFSLYWDAAAKKAGPSKESESRGSRGVHVVLANVALLMEVIPVRGLGRFVPVSVLFMGVGLAVQAAGLSIAVWARRHLGRNWSGAIAIKVEHRLIRSGPYRVLRHPIYTGILTMYAGTTLVTGEWLAVIGLAMAIFAYWRKLRLEDAVLAGAFGAEYDAYRRDTWALVPGLF